MNTLKVKNIIIGQGIPKICVSITGKSFEKIVEQSMKILHSCADIVEWRVDYFEDIFNINSILTTLKQIRNILSNIPIIFTLRSQNQGGNLHIDINYYINLNKIVCDSQLADFIDIELYTAKEYILDIIEYAHNKNCYLICSYHNFNKTPTTEKMISILEKMNSLNCDILKLSVMPHNNLDVLHLLTATTKANVQKPIITISMSKLGTISRISGQLFGSSITFACIDKSSAPGQIQASTLKHTLKLLNISR